MRQPQPTAQNLFTLLGSLTLLSACGHTGSPINAPTTVGVQRSLTLFIRSAVEHPEGTVTFPLQRGVTPAGRTVWYVVLDSSDANDARARGVNHAEKLARARGSAAVQRVRLVNGVIEFPATVDFRPVRRVTPGPGGFPPSLAEPGAVGEVGYSPLIELPDGTVLNAPQVANDTGQADKVTALDLTGGTVTYRETRGFQGGRPVRYVSTDASDRLAAALEGVTFAPALNAAPFAGGDDTDSARASLAAFTNGQIGANNPERQGLNSALLDGLDPLNVLAWNPNQDRYSPLWDVFLARWSETAVQAGQNPAQRDFGQVRGLGSRGRLTAPDGKTFGPSGFVVDCPIVSED